jgi:hypothetical protein
MTKKIKVTSKKLELLTQKPLKEKAQKTIGLVARESEFQSKLSASEKPIPTTCDVSTRTNEPVIPSVPSQINNPELDKFCAKNDIQLTDLIKLRIASAVKTYKDGEKELERIQNDYSNGSSHKGRRQEELRRLSSAIKTLSPDTRDNIVLYGKFCSIDVLEAFAGILSAVDKANQYETLSPQKPCDEPLRELLKTLCSVYEQARGRKASATREGPFHKFCCAASSNRIGHKAIVGAIAQWRRMIHRSFIMI